VTLHPNYPNPFNPETTISFSIPVDAHVRLTLYDTLGRTVGILLDEKRAAGRYTYRIQAADLAAGLYLYRLEAGGVDLTLTMLLAK
jgi:hypothetical protein